MRWAFAIFLVSNLALIALYLATGFRWLLIMQLGFTATSLLGIYRGFFRKSTDDDRPQCATCPHRHTKPI
jgi:hypothetical protein